MDCRCCRFSQGKPTGYTIANALVFSKVQKELGLDRSQQYTGAAPISTDVLEFLASVGIVVLELYGLSECTGELNFDGFKIIMKFKNKVLKMSPGGSGKARREWMF